MARPKIIVNGTKLNIYLPRAVKQTLIKMSRASKKSASQFVTDLVVAEEKKGFSQA